MTKHNTGRFVILAVLLACGVLGSASPAAAKDMQTAAKEAVVGKKSRLKQDMRKLWADHVIWTRGYIVAAVAGTPDAKAAAARLMKNQEDIGNAFIPYYGARAGAKLTGLLKQHILIAADVVAAAKAQDKAKFNAANARWQGNARQIAAYLSAINPNWDKGAVTSMFYEHLAATNQEASARINKDWAGDIKAFDKLFSEIMTMADDFSAGIVKQFPEKF